MIITKQKELDKILEKLKNRKNIFIVGCAACATKCATGGEDQVQALSVEMSKHGLAILGSMVLDTPCDIRVVKKDLARDDKAQKAESLVLLTCGAGVQAISSVLEDKELVPALDTMFLGTIERLGNFHQFCSLCGDCIIDETGGICPVTRCAKSLVNGPCGGALKGKCEVNSENDCAWITIYDKLKKNKTGIKKYHNIKNNAAVNKPQKVKTR